MPAGIRRRRSVITLHLWQIEGGGLIGWQRNGGHDVDAVELFMGAGMDHTFAACLINKARWEVV